MNVLVAGLGGRCCEPETFCCLFGWRPFSFERAKNSSWKRWMTNARLSTAESSAAVSMSARTHLLHIFSLSAWTTKRMLSSPRSLR